MKMDVDIWPEAEIRLKDLQDFDKNPRRISKARFDELIKSIKEDGYHTRIKVNLDNKTVGGHQRRKALLALGFKPNDLIKVLVPPKLLTEEEFRRVNFRDNLNYGEYDMEMVANNYDADQLLDWGFPEEWLPVGEEETNEEKKVDGAGEKKTTCPECGHEF